MPALACPILNFQSFNPPEAFLIIRNQHKVVTPSPKSPLKEIADYLGAHYNIINKVIKRIEN